MAARIFWFSLDELRRKYAVYADPEVDPRQDTKPFRAFRGALLAHAQKIALGEASVSMWWEGSYNGYALAVAFEPPEALPEGASFDAICFIDDERTDAARRDAHLFGRIGVGTSDVVTDEDSATPEAPFGSPTGHFGAPGIKLVPYTGGP